MPCDRAPKSLLAGATVVDTSGGRVETPQRPGVHRSYRGPRTGRRDMRVAREPERSCHFRRATGWGPGYQLQVDPQLGPELVGTKKGRTTVSPNEGDEVRRDERQEVGASRSNDEAGELDRRTPRSEGDAVSNNRWRETWRVHRTPWTWPRNNSG